MKGLFAVLLLLFSLSNIQAQINALLKDAYTNETVDLVSSLLDDEGEFKDTFVITWSCEWCYPACYNVIQSFEGAAKSGLVNVVSVNIDGKENWDSNCSASVGGVYWDNGYITDLYLDEELNSTFDSFFSTSNAPLTIYFNEEGAIQFMSASYNLRAWMFADYFGEELIWHDSGNLNSYAWNYYTDNKGLGPVSESDPDMAQAMRMIKRSLSLDKNYYNTDTYASLLYLSGQYNEALKMAKEAIDIAKENEEDYDSTSELIQTIIDEM